MTPPRIRSTLGAIFERPVYNQLLWLRGRGQAGHNFATSYYLDGALTLGLQVQPAYLDLGLRAMILQTTASSPFQAAGPVASLRFTF